MKKIFACALCVVMTVSLCSCAGCRKKEETKAKEKETIELWHYWDIPDNQRHLEELVEQFNKMQEDIKIEVSYIPDEDFKKQLALAMSEEKMPDIAVVDSSDFQFLHHMKAFADLTDAIPELKEYNEKALEPCTIDGRIYGQPFGTFRASTATLRGCACALLQPVSRAIIEREAAAARVFTVRFFMVIFLSVICGYVM